jgi:hypothetical protein
MANEREQACDCGSVAIAMFDLTVSAMARVGNSIITENSSERTIESSTNMTKKNTHLPSLKPLTSGKEISLVSPV